ncbi:MAG TPA: DUF971 domain-containing protein [Acidobacteriaceae bacterium]
MSHEGITFVSQEQAQRAENTPPKLTGEAISPAKVRVDKTGGTGMKIDWRDGHSSAWTFAWLRAACPCATCHEERDADGRDPGTAKPKPASLLPLYEAPAKPVEVTPVGKYALRFKWNDGHEAGLYSWDYLRNVCDRIVREQSDAK